MRRFFAENLDIGSDTVLLTGDEARHIKTVLRMREGDEVLLINGTGTECLAVITSLTDDSVALRIEDRQVCSADPAVTVTLIQCLPKQGKMEVIIQKCVELGVSRIIPAVSRRCVVKPDGRDGKLLRWQKVAQEAAKQCGRAKVPGIDRPSELAKLDLSAFDSVLIAYENEDENSLKAVLRSGNVKDNIAIVIGPEGGFEPAEVERVLSCGGTAVSLGRRILRTETAGMAMLAQIMYELEQ